MKKILSLVLALMLIVIIPVEAVAATTTNAASKGNYAPEGGTYYGFLPVNQDQSYPLYIAFLSTDVTTELLICVQDETVLDFIKDNITSMTVSAIAAQVAKMTGHPIVGTTIEVVVGFAMWGLSKAKINAMKDARNESADKKIVVTQWCAPPLNWTVETFSSWEGNYVDYEAFFPSSACLNSPNFIRGDYGPYNIYK